MSWRDNLIQASFKGVPFKAEIIEDAYGWDIKENSKFTIKIRKPDGSTTSSSALSPFTETVARRRREVGIRAHFSGDDYQTDLNRFIAAVKSGTRGVLALPNRDPMAAFAMQLSVIWDNTEGGWETVIVRFVEAGELNTPTTAIGTSDTAKDAASAWGEALVASFVDVASTVGFPDYVADGLQDNTESFLDTAEQALTAGQASTGGTSTYDLVFDKINNVRNNIIDAVSTPANLAADVSAVMSDIEYALSTPDAVVDACLYVYDTFGELQIRAEAIGTTAAKQQQQANQIALQILVQSLSLIGISNVLSDLEFASVDDAVTLRAAIFDRIDELQTYIGDQSIGDWSTVYKQLTAARAAIWADLAARTAALPVIETMKLQEEIPAVVLAYAKYADAERYDEITDRNDTTRSLFVSGEIKLLTA